MNIGIITLPLNTNYGGIMQAYALQTVLEKMGHDVSVVNVPNLRMLPCWKRPMAYVKRGFDKYVLGKDTYVFKEKKKIEHLLIQTKKIRPFVDSRIHLLSLKDFKEVDKGAFDAFVVGSDQVWRPSYENHIFDAYLNFAIDWDVKRVAYAVSFGTDVWEYTKQQTLKCSQLVKLFDAVSVREDSGIQLCRNYLGCDATITLDPTLLLTESEYLDLLGSQNESKSASTILCYILDYDDEKEQLVNEFSVGMSAPIYRVDSKANENNLRDDDVFPSVECWLRGFYDADFIVTDSFHACVFSIIFKKPFAVLSNPRRGMARIRSLLKMFDLEDRIVTNRDDFQSLGTIDYSKVYSALEETRNDSIRFLMEALKI